jgi:hypothetical protein
LRTRQPCVQEWTKWCYKVFRIPVFNLNLPAVTLMYRSVSPLSWLFNLAW